MLSIAGKRRWLGKKKQIESLWRNLPTHCKGLSNCQRSLCRSYSHFQLSLNNVLLKIGNLLRLNGSPQHGPPRYKEENPLIFRSHSLFNETSRNKAIHRFLLLLQIQIILQNLRQHHRISQKRSLHAQPSQILRQGNQSCHLFTVFGILQNREIVINGQRIWSFDLIHR